MNPTVVPSKSGVWDGVAIKTKCFQLIHLPSTPLLPAYQQPAGSQNFNFEPTPEPVRQAAAAPPPSAGVSPPLSHHFPKLQVYFSAKYNLLINLKSISTYCCCKLLNIAKNTQSWLASASQMWIFDGFLSLLWQWTEHFWVLNYWSLKTRHLKTAALASGNHYGHFLQLRQYVSHSNTF